MQDKTLKQMELGGSDAYIILDDVDLEEATDLATFGRLQNNGQTCIAAKRFIVHDAIYDALTLFTKKKDESCKNG
jgi:succinate-semialdehyde dehydrogenase/glutarate-semialdehyde dehydrogenase